jgi:hypothetical protein
MRLSIRPTILATTALIGLGAFAAGLPALAAPPTPAATTSATPVAATQSSTIEDRITDLHTSLAITAAEQPQWDAFAKVMRDNAQSMDEAFQTRLAALDTMTAPQNLQSYQTIAMAHAQGMQKLVPAFQALYDTMPADQQKVADQVFHDQPHGAASKGG